MSETAYIPRYSISDYLNWEGDWELWDGHAVSMSPSPSFNHQRIASQLHLLLAQALKDHSNCGHCQVIYEIDWHIDDCTVVRPDLLILCGEAPTAFLKRPPVFIAEILSPSTATKDRTHKRALYQSQGVNYYLLVDPDDQQCELLALDHNGVYQSIRDSELQLDENCGIELEARGLFD